MLRDTDAIANLAEDLTRAKESSKAFSDSITLEHDVHVGYGMHVAWFKDPDGNILNIVSR
jgi:hypothetical protein